jgi:AMP nucleosidase
MKTKQEIVENWLPRYTGRKLEDFTQHILLTNFNQYVEEFASIYGVKITREVNMPNASANGITIINFGMGSANAATIMDLLRCDQSKSLPVYRKMWRAEEEKPGRRPDTPHRSHPQRGTSDDYLPAEVPALPAFMLQRAVSSAIRDYGRDYWTGTVFTTNKRVWEYDERFKKYLMKTRSMAIDMETATIFVVGFYNEIPSGALLLVSDQPMISTGVKTAESDKIVTKQYMADHLQIGINALRELIDGSKSVKHLQF